MTMNNHRHDLASATPEQIHAVQATLGRTLRQVTEERDLRRESGDAPGTRALSHRMERLRRDLARAPFAPARRLREGAGANGRRLFSRDTRPV